MRAFFHPIAIFLSVLALPLSAAPPELPAGLDPEPLDRLLRQYRTSGGLVDYEAWRKNPADRAALDAWIASAARPGPAAAGREHMALIANLYHALLLRELLVRPDLASPKGDRRFFTKPVFTAASGSRCSLDDLASRGLVSRMGWRARGLLHLGCRGGPPLPAAALRASTLDAQVNANWQAWLASPHHFQATADRIRLSPLLLWHKHELEPEGGFRNLLAPYLPAESAALLARKDIRVEYLPFDWTLASPHHPPGSYGPARLLRERWWPW